MEGKAVAGTIFTAVIVYAVRDPRLLLSNSSCATYADLGVRLSLCFVVSRDYCTSVRTEEAQSPYRSLFSATTFVYIQAPALEGNSRVREYILFRRFLLFATTLLLATTEV